MSSTLRCTALQHSHLPASSLSFPSPQIACSSGLEKAGELWPFMVEQKGPKNYEVQISPPKLFIWIYILTKIEKIGHAVQCVCRSRGVLRLVVAFSHGTCLSWWVVKCVVLRWTCSDDHMSSPQGHPWVYGSWGATEGDGLRQQCWLVLPGLYALQTSEGVSGTTVLPYAWTKIKYALGQARLSARTLP